MSQLGSKHFQFYEQFSSPRPSPPLPKFGVMKFLEWFLPPYLVGLNGIPRCLVFSRSLGLGRGDPDSQVQVLLHAFVQSSKYS